MTQDFYYDRHGQPLRDSEAWSRLFSDPSYKRVAEDHVTDEVWVSTVWLGLNHNWGDGPPMIFETMVFGGPWDEDQWRYSTEEEALAGHRLIVAGLRAGTDPPAA